VLQLGPRKLCFWSGVAPGFRTFVAFDPSGDSGLVMLTNTDLPPSDARMEMAGFPLLAILASVDSAATPARP
jgi:CubicO group peptidase (beta-lactamase class C family)